MREQYFFYRQCYLCGLRTKKKALIRRTGGMRKKSSLWWCRDYKACKLRRLFFNGKRNFIERI